LKRTALKSTPDKVRDWHQRTRRSLPAVSAKRQKENRIRCTETMPLVRERDGNRCQLQEGFGTPCFGALHGHELLKRSRGGSITDPAGIVLACDRHNDDVERYPLLAEGLGYSAPSR
jgi:hypothetical protein